MVVCLAVMPALQSCDDNDGYSIGDFTPPLWATVRVTGNAFYLDCDVWGTLWPVNTDLGWYEPVDGKRVITIFNPLSDGFDGYDHAVKLLRLYDVLTKEVETLTPETEEDFGNDPVAIFKGDIGIRILYSSRTCLPKRNIVSVWYARKTMRKCTGRMATYIWNSVIITMMT